MEDKSSLIPLVRQHLEDVEPHHWQQAHSDFQTLGYVRVPFLLSDYVKSMVTEEAEALIAKHGVRRELALAETGDTPRKMRNVDRARINQHGDVVRAIYFSQDLIEALQRIAGETVHPCPYEAEQFVITQLEDAGDTHGWHWDDYSFALVTVIECPRLEDGGFIQYVPHTQWDKKNPQLHRQFISHPIHSAELHPGDVYLMRTNTTMHRVYPISRGSRLIVNMAYASHGDLTKEMSHETMDTLWADSTR